MKFMKGMLVGTLISAGVVYMMHDNENSKKKIIKKGKIMVAFFEKVC